MLAKKKKLTKKQIKEDRLVTGYYEVQKFYEQNQSKILAAVAVIAVVVVAIFWYTSKIEQDNRAASAQLALVIPIFNEGSYAEAIEGKPGTNIIGLRQIVDSYSGAEQAEVSRLYLANALYALARIDEAYKEYDGYSGSNNILAAAALAGKAACYEVKGDYEDAADAYLRASKIEKTNPQNPDYLLSAAKNSINASDNSGAEDLLKKIKKDYANTPASREADKYLAYINA